MRSWGHQFVYDKELLISLFQKVGFKDMVEVGYGQSEHKEFQNVERHADIEWME